jgi:tetratricopeptide (TPR) repeat protein
MYGSPSQTQPQPALGTIPGAYPPGWAPAGTPGAGVAQPRAPLPRWFLYAAAGLVVIGLFLVWLTGSDWANGGVRAGIAALVVAGVVLVAFLVRYAQGFRSTQTVSLALAAVLVLIILGAAGIGLQNSFHSLQGNSLDGQQNFQAAINEFKLANDTEDIAKTYNDWGEYLLSKHEYQAPQDPTQDAADGTQANSDGAVNKFAVVLAHYQSAADQVSRAEEGEVNAYLAWGDSYLSASQYQDAVNVFKKAVDAKSTLGSIPNFSRIHVDAAKAYLGLGQQQVSDGTTSGDCTSAVQTYQTLASDYSDTSQGQQAATELKKPQNVIGVVVDYSTQQPVGKVKLFLSSKWQVANGVFNASNDNVATSGSDGTFKFANITPGSTKYLISYIINGREEIVVSAASGQPANVVTVQPLCATNAGLVPYNLPGA